MIKRLFIGLILFLALWSSWWAWGQDQWISQRFFTTQSVWLVVMSMFTLWRLGPKHPFVTGLVSITTLNMLITGLVYHLVLEVENFHFQAHLSHTILPLGMMVIFLWVLDDSLPYRRFWWLLIYPLTYLFFFILFGESIAWYPYPFMDVSVLGLMPVLRFSLGVLAPVFAGLALLLLTLKKRLKKDHPKMV